MTYPSTWLIGHALKEISRREHLILVMTPEMRQEWNSIQRKLARKWRKNMYQHGRLHSIRSSFVEKFRQKVIDSVTSAQKKEVVSKDMMLVEATLMTEGIVVSVDKKAYENFREVARHIEEVRRIGWVNPEMEGEGSIQWLKRGTRLTQNRILGA